MSHHKILCQLKELVRKNHYLMTLHAEEEMNEDELSIFDIEYAILTGKLIEKQKDEKYDEWKYIIRGYTLDNDAIFIVAKISPTEKLVIITVFRDN